jgi:hypothetical protein
MIHYFSGGGVTGVWQPVNEMLIRKGAGRCLSFAYPKSLTQYCDLAKSMGVRSRVMMDSGAFSAWTQGRVVDLEKLSATFAALLDGYGDRCEFVLINLDVIPGRKGVDATPEQIADAVQRSRENFAILKKRFAGLVLPVFHQDEPLTYFQALVNEAPYVCLSPRNDLAEKQRVKWAKDFSDRALNCRFHGLAATGFNMTRKVQWHSVDSAAWIRAASYGTIFWPSSKRLQKLAVTSRSKKFDLHVEHLNPALKRKVIDVIKGRGYSLDTLQSDDTERYKWNAEHWLRAALRPSLLENLYNRV